MTTRPTDNQTTTQPEDQTTRPTENRGTFKHELIKAANQTILTMLVIVVPVFISFVINPNNNVVTDLLITFGVVPLILMRLIVYSVNN